MSANRFVALLRGINVGGNNKVAMADLRFAFEAEGFGEVRTYINSGNVLFEADSEPATLEDRVEEMLSRRLGIDVVVVVRSRRQLENVIRRAPDGFGEQPDLYHSDVVFLKTPLTPDRALGVVELRQGVDQAWAGSGVLYFSRLSARRTQSKLSKLMGKPEYKLMTIRNWNTTTKLVAMGMMG
jgi:uncharacterized protein (DUF1697 family)